MITVYNQTTDNPLMVPFDIAITFGIKEGDILSETRALDVQAAIFTVHRIKLETAEQNYDKNRLWTTNK